MIDDAAAAKALTDWRRNRIVLIGQAPGPTGPPPGRPLVGGRSGTKMQMLCACEDSLKEYLRHFETMNVLDKYPGRHKNKGDNFPMMEARLAAREKLPLLRGRRVVFVGSAVAEAFDAVSPVTPFEWRARKFPPDLYHVGAFDEVYFQWAMVPHPSPINTFWNEPKNVDAARHFFRWSTGRDA